MPPKAKEQKKGIYKQGTLLKDIVPPTVKQPPREGKPVRPAEYTPSTTIVNPYQPQPEFEDWPGDETALNFDFGVDSQTGKCYTDPVNFPTPPSFKAKESDIVFWSRPKELVKHDMLEGPLSLASLTNKSRLKRQKTGIEGDSSTGRLSIDESTGLGPYDKEDLDMKLFNTMERDETVEEAEQRVKEMLEKQQQQKKKPTGKKDDVVDTNPQKIKEVKLSNISMKEKIPAYSKWIASQLQVIKDRDIRDVNTHKPIWTKIYPQREGVPVLNPSGRYWVKLYHMGKEKKIDIDDRVPVIYGESLFAKSVNSSEIWTYILSKALIKLNSSRWNDPKSKEGEVGDGSIIYALTGYVPETISIASNLSDKWRSISYALSDKKYNSGDKYITCFSLPGYKPSAPSNKVRNTKDISVDSKRSGNRKESIRVQGPTRGTSVPKTTTSDNSLDPQSASSTGSPLRKKDQPSMTVVRSPRQDAPSSRRDDGLREKPSNVLTGFAYSVVDAFENDNFNMAYAIKRSENEIRLRTELANMQKVSINKMSREEKVEHRRIMKDIKEKLSIEDAKRRELVKIPAEHYRLVKIKSSIGNVSALNFYSFDQDDVTLARKCMLNKLSKPPNYDLYDAKQEEKSVSSAQVLESQKVLPLDDFSRIDNFKEPAKRPPGGAWLTDQDLEGCFQYLQVFHDPTRFKYKETHTNNARPDEELMNYEDKEVIVIEAHEEEEKEREKDRDHVFSQHTFLYSFTSTRPANMAVEPKPSFVLQKYDFHHFEVAQSYKPLNQVHDSNCLTLENKNQIFRVHLTSPMNCYWWISSDMHYKLMSVADFLCTYEGYQVKNQQIDYPIIEKNRYHLFYKGIINSMNERDQIICRLKNATDSVMLRSLRIKLIELTDKGYTSEEAFKTGVVTFPLEKAYYNSKFVPIKLETGKRYMIVIEGRATETVNEGTLDFDVLFSSSEFNIETVEQVEPLEYMDKYVPTKYGVLFSERVFVNNEAQASFFARISDVVGNSGQQQAQKGKKGDVVQVEEKDIVEQRAIKLELLRDNELVAFAFGQNKAALTNVTLYPTNNKDEPRSYLLQARFDLREWPECKEENEHTNSLHWTLKVCGSDTIAIIRDTIKEENVKAIKKSWEDKEPGRAERAKIARKKFLIMQKVKKGEHVEPDELNLVNEPRQKKNKEEEQKKDAKGKPAPPKGKAPPAKGPAGKKEETPIEEKKEEKVLPKSGDHIMSEICSFLTHMEQPRLLIESAEGPKPVVRTEEEQRELREKILLGREEIYGITERNKQSSQKIKETLEENKEKVVKGLQVKRQERKEQISSIMKDREEFRKKDKEVKDKIRVVTALCKQEKPVLEDIVKVQNEYTGQVDPELLKILEKVRKNAYIGEKVDRMNAALAVYDVQTVTAVLEEFRSEEIEMDEELYVKAEEMIDLAEKNPTFIETKQKEAQKTKGKKK